MKKSKPRAPSRDVIDAILQRRISGETNSASLPSSAA